jgi:hypothetical protein
MDLFLLVGDSLILETDGDDSASVEFCGKRAQTGPMSTVSLFFENLCHKIRLFLQDASGLRTLNPTAIASTRLTTILVHPHQ